MQLKEVLNLWRCQVSNFGGFIVVNGTFIMHIFINIENTLIRVHTNFKQHVLLSYSSTNIFFNLKGFTRTNLKRYGWILLFIYSKLLINSCGYFKSKPGSMELKNRHLLIHKMFLFYSKYLSENPISIFFVHFP